MNYEKHNEEVRRLLQQAEEGKCERVMMELAMNPRMIISDPMLNPRRITFEEYLKNPQIMLEIQCQFQEYCAESLISDRIMGFENLQEITPYPDFQNVLEGACLGCEIAFHGCNEPGTKVCADETTKYELLKNTRPLTDPLGGIVSTLLSHYEFFKKKREEGYTYKGKPLGSPGMAGMGTDGPFTIACSLIGATQACMDLYVDQDYMMELLDYITEAVIARNKALRRCYGQPEKSKSFGFADDSIALLSLDTYTELILPFHKKMMRELCTGEEPGWIHLCGDASRFFPTLVRELNAGTFDTGFPIDHGRVVRELGPDITVKGGVHIETLRAGTAEEVANAAKTILEAVKPFTRKFIIKEANNLSPGTPPENLSAMHEAVRRYGYYK
ncbi:uroporphyrinogen decarboxylase family protein [Faecalicatena contorta]|uniref:uroporphyrinogen decarboxylase family protein n=1 Tax=Faecalicatena contorta TaxID=39482 RepID=UPI0015647EBC|nr:uroporphyrinogen decarboxylase family protein [Faecalicatena contorta]